MGSVPGYIDASEVKDLVEKKDTSTTIIDVRDEDFFDAHIRGARQVPSGHFQSEKEVDGVIGQLTPQTKLVVVHCMLSQIRGPKCANRLCARLHSEAWQKLEQKPEVKILRNGFEGFHTQYAKEAPELFERQIPRNSNSHSHST